MFNPDNLSVSPDAPSYTIILPPPNVTDRLHMGHASLVAIEDLLIRYRRLCGDRTLWLPGTDHAAIATQNVVERKLMREQGKTRHELGRENFLAAAESFALTTQEEILHQMRKLGASLDWSRLAFTLDEPRQKAVRRMFKDMYEAGAIYRGERLVNWCPRCQSTLADDEVEYKPQEAKLYTFRYDRDFPLSISTTRPETKLGDTAVAVHPSDERYQKYIGQELTASFCGHNLKIKVISDYRIDPAFGTGALGVTPAHSAADGQMAAMNNLEIVKVIDERGLIRPGFGSLSGLPVAVAREQIVASLREQGLMEKEEDLLNNLSVCYRCGTAIEPLPSLQWFVAVDKPLERLGGKSLKEKALAVAREGAVTFVPDRFAKRYLDWMENLHDWCISRQIWFGHRVPVWYRGEEVFVGDSVPPGEGWQQDPDTLDTWFSSGMWTFSTLGWPDNFKDGRKLGDLAKFHPTQVLETGYEIITLWVSRMIMMSLFAVGEIPFRQVYLHGLVLDQDGKKMSKSKGNGVNPIDMIGRFGADASRLAILMGATPGNDSRFSVEKVEAKRNFINKLWNISRFILSTAAADDLANQDEPEPTSLADRWILAEYNRTVATVTEHLDNLNLSAAAEALTSFTVDSLADWYLEAAKVEKGKEAILAYLLKNLLVLWHPFAPFVTETIWESFNNDLLMAGRWPQASIFDEAKDFNRLQEMIVAIRNARSLNRIAPAKKIQAIIYARQDKGLVDSQAELIKQLRTGISALRVEESGPVPDGAIACPAAGVEIYLLGGVDKEEERARLTKELDKLAGLISTQETKLANQEFVARAPAPLVQAERQKLKSYQEDRDRIIKVIANL